VYTLTNSARARTGRIGVLLPSRYTETGGRTVGWEIFPATQTALLRNRAPDTADVLTLAAPSVLRGWTALLPGQVALSLRTIAIVDLLWGLLLASPLLLMVPRRRDRGRTRVVADRAVALSAAVLAACLALPPAALRAQAPIPRDRFVWLSASSTMEFPRRTDLTLEFHERRFADSWRAHQRVLRGNLGRRIANDVRIGVGYTHFLQGALVDSGGTQPFAVELRPHLQLDVTQPLSSSLRLTHRSRLEYRALQGSANRATTTAARLRHRVQLEWAPAASRVGLRLSDELHVQVGDRPVARLFEQNRVQVGLRVRLRPSLATEFGYLWWNQRRRDGATVQRDHFRIAIEHVRSRGPR
jgi:hypothetical protein